jgi:hypothetical protein
VQCKIAIGRKKYLIHEVSGYQGGDYEENPFLWDLTPCNSTSSPTFLRKFSKLLPGYTASHPIGYYPLYFL